MRNIAILLILILNAPVCGAQVYKTEFTVAQDDSGHFKSIQAAIDACKAFPDVPITIRIKPGVYHEKVKVYSWNPKLKLVGESPESTIISYDDHFDKIDKGRNSTFHTSTLLVEANDIHVENLTIENTAGPVGQAVALHVEGDRCSFVNCRFLGNQDTMYAAGEGARQFFDNCTIEGTTDFIFGEATSVFRNCTLIAKADSYITAASTGAKQPFGFVFIDCDIKVAEGVRDVYLGRPWRTYARTVFIGCNMPAQINPSGWNNWNNKEAEVKGFYGEYESHGAGARPDVRVPWSHQLTKKQRKYYTLLKILRGWNPLN